MLKPRQRFTKKQLKEDKLLTAIAKTQAYVEQEWTRLLLIAGSAALIVLFGVIYISSSRAEREEASSELYVLEYQYIEQGIYNDQLAQDLLNYLSKHEETVSGGNATFYLANTYYNLGKYQESENYFRKYLDDYDGIKFLQSSATAGIAASYEQRKMYKEASDYYLRSVKDYPDEFTLPENMLGAARTLSFAGEREQAREQCTVLIERFPNTNEAVKAQIILSRY